VEPIFRRLNSHGKVRTCALRSGLECVTERETMTTALTCDPKVSSWLH
jgi:hypothetical protein